MIANFQNKKTFALLGYDVSKEVFFLNEKKEYKETYGEFSSQNVSDLIYMTPHGFRASREKIKLITDNPSFRIMIDVLMSSYLAM